MLGISKWQNRGVFGKRGLAAACIALALGACADGGSTSEATSDATTPTSGRTSSSTTAAECGPDSADATELEALLAAQVPRGYIQQPDDVGDTGPSDLEKAARDDGGGEAAQVLTDLRFVRGYQRLWATEGGDELLLFLYEFCDESGAQGYLARGQEAFSAPDSGLEPFTPTGVPTETGYRSDDGATGSVVLPASAGRYLVQVAAVGDTRADPWDTYFTRAADLLNDQLDRL